MEGKHKRVLRDGQISRGPERWARAAANALQRPNTQAARLYLRRSALAYQVSEECHNSMDVDPMQAYEHLALDWSSWSPEPKRTYVTCSVYCTVMQVQLDHPEGSLADISAVFSTNHESYRVGDTGVPKVRQLQRGTLKRAVRCQFCGDSVK